MGCPQIAVRTDSNRTGDGVAPGSAELVVVGEMHVKKVEKSGIECWKCG